MNVNSPKVSIIVPVYNVEKYLHRCVDSILLQTFTDFELLLIDDGSTDKSVDICDKYALKDRRIRVFHKKNGGVSSARNLGIKKSSGVYILFVDSDDYLSPSHLNNYIKYIGNYEIVYQGYCVFMEYSHNSEHVFTISEKSANTKDCMIDVLSDLLEVGNIFGYTWSKMFHAEIINKNNILFKEDISIREDEIFTFEYCRYIKSIKVLQSTTYHYQLSENSLMRRRYFCPDELLKEINYSYTTAIQITHNKRFRKIIEDYYATGLDWIFNMLYSPTKLLKRKERLKFLRIMEDWNLKHPESVCSLRNSVEVADRLNFFIYPFRVLKYVIKILLWKLH